jgi:hypothetical protein
MKPAAYRIYGLFILTPVHCLEFSRPRQESEKLHHTALVQKRIEEFRLA